MEPWLLAAASSVVVSIAAAARRRRRLRRFRRGLLESCGVTHVQGGHRLVTGRHGALAVSLFSYSDTTRRGTRVVVDGLAGDVAFSPTGAVHRALGSSDLETGDLSFDDAFVVAGVPSTVRAVLRSSTRRRALHILAAGRRLAVLWGTLSVEFGRMPGQAEPLTPAALDEVLALAHDLETPADPAPLLAESARTDRAPAVRVLALATLHEERPDHPDTRVALLAGTEDPAPAVRLLAARALGGGADTVLRALLDDPDSEDSIAAGALAALGNRVAPEEVRTVLLRAVATGGPALVLGALHASGRGGPEDVPALAKALEESTGAAAVAAAQALGRTGSPAAEAPLVALLGAPDAPVAAAAAAALAACGTVGAVPDLRTAETRGGEIRRAARTAIASIQGRLTGANPGQVSLAGGDAGQLSVTGAADGRVSLETEE